MISKDAKRTLPHREPFLWVHRLVERHPEGLSGVVELDVDPNLEVFRGHFPGNPVFPGVLQIEAAAQSCLWAYLGVLPEGSPLPEVLFVAIDEYKFKRPVVPPATLRFLVKQSQVRSKLQLWDAEVFVGDALVSKGAFWLRMLSPGFSPELSVV